VIDLSFPLYRRYFDYAILTAVFQMNSLLLHIAPRGLLLLLLSICPSIHAESSAGNVESISATDLQNQFEAIEIKPLQAGEQSFTVLEKPAMTAFTKGTVILVPDWSQHAASPRMINLLRQQLVDYGWNTMAMMVPPPMTETTAETLLTYQTELLARLQAVMKSTENSTGSIIVVAQGSSGALVNQLYQSGQLTPPEGLILLSAYLPDKALNQAVSVALAKHKIPTLDLQQQQDNAFVMASSQLRLQLVRKHIKEIYRQRLLPGSFDQPHNQQWVFNEIYGWLSYLGF
jgi:hypothetical protein